MKKILLLCFAFALQYGVWAQSSVTGTVTDDSGFPIPGVSILKLRSTVGTVTDLDGKYSINASTGDELQFTFIGFKPQVIPVGSSSEINVVLEEDLTNLNEVVVIGYGSATKRELTGATSQVKGEAIEAMNMPRVDQALQGKIAGVNISTNSGAPGGTSNIRIRGIGTFGDNDPLILVDGVIYDAAGLNALNPNDIESVNVLKDGTAGIYGVRAANGVILIETKKGSLGAKPRLDFNAYYGVQETARKLDLLNAREYAILKNEAFAAGGQALPFNNVNLGEGTNWQDAVFQEAPIQEYNLTMTGGTEKTSYSIGGSYFGQQGIVGGPKANFERYNARINFITEIAPRVKFTNVLLYTREESSGLAQGGIGSVLYNTINAYPTETIRVGDRFSYLDNVNDIINPLAQMENTYNNTFVNKFVGKEEIEYKINSNFTWTGRAGYNFAMVDTKVFNPLVWYGPGKFANSARNANLDPVLVDVGGLEIERGANVFEARNTFLDYNLETFLNYDSKFGEDHRVKGMFGLSLVGNRSEGLNGTGFNIPNNDLNFADISANQAPGGFLNNAGSFQSRQRLTSAFIRGEYDFKQRYFVSAILRRDGSTNFGPNNRIGYFPAISGAWLISDESFFNVKAIDFMKLRTSFGVSGNDQIGLFRYRGLLNGSATYVFNDLIVNGAAIGNTSNPDLKWETTFQTNIGLDFSLFQNIDFTANYFIKNTKDLLFQPDVSALLGSYGPGGSPPVINAGDVLNRGLELELGYGSNRKTGVNFRFDYNITFLKNEVTAVPEGFEFIPGAGFGVGGNVATRFQKGFPIGYFVGYQTDGIFQTAEEIASSSVSQPGAEPGDLRFVDQNGDGVINFGDDSDRTMIGSPIPNMIMGFNFNVDFKGFDLGANVYAALGQDIIRNYERQQPFANQLAYNIDRWTGPGTSNEVPRLTTGATRNTVFSDFYVEDGSFVRLRNVQLGYTIPSTISQKIGIQYFRFYLAANNLVTLTRYQGFDPDVGSGNPLFAGVDNGIYPQARTFMAGLNIKF
ncbi:SusC/RagA family TonB-linked outer membrane protein [Belliella aquatica]|uniref:SusC/RagA family TonB-linked outer membrane protein n=1 Tax=Belliella aquatica TaxID=1323734 RepID=A0ABQ1M9R1_9BACT|nr:TonB-dependent receptor [Belliella aquatica]MCH7404669.1 TonB-dependent receptor [Belliella aquatica]GGC35033.1 SusC/RagA family TonB-linked outer membrane protein [Belliella aquatica]